jgi:hypothetical protein
VVVLLIAIRRATLKTNFWCGSFFGWCAAVSVYYSTVCRIVEWCGGMVTEQCSRKLDFTKYSSAWEYSQQVTQQTKLKISKWGSQKVYSCWKCNNNIFGTSLTFVMSRSWQEFKDQKVNYIFTWLITDLVAILQNFFGQVSDITKFLTAGCQSVLILGCRLQRIYYVILKITCKSWYRWKLYFLQNHFNIPM